MTNKKLTSLCKCPSAVYVPKTNPRTKLDETGKVSGRKREVNPADSRFLPEGIGPGAIGI